MGVAESEPNPLNDADVEKLDDDTEQNTALEQWRFYGQTTLNVSNRRLKNNRFYQRLLGATLAGVGIGATLGVVGAVLLLVVGIVGVAVSLLWMAHIISYKQLNSGKYTVMSQIADDLPHEPFQEEWNNLDRGRDPSTYVTHTSVEIWWPRVSLWVFGMMALYGGTVKASSPDLAFWVALVWSLLILAYAVAAFRGWKPFELIAPLWKQRSEDDE